MKIIPLSQNLLTVHSIPVNEWGPCLVHVGALTTLILFKFCAGNHVFYELMCVTATLCPKDPVKLLPKFSLLHSLHPFFS